MIWLIALALLSSKDKGDSPHIGTNCKWKLVHKDDDDDWCECFGYWQLALSNGERDRCIYVTRPEYDRAQVGHWYRLIKANKVIRPAADELMIREPPPKAAD